MGVVLVAVFSILRLRFTWWPLHPVMFLVWGTYPMMRFSHSFLLGWAIKVAVTRLGGGRKYRELMPFMIGAIAGDLLGGLVFMILGGAYYGTEGVIPPAVYRIFPG
jgi:hypothetical protein